MLEARNERSDLFGVSTASNALMKIEGLRDADDVAKRFPSACLFQTVVELKRPVNHEQVIPRRLLGCQLLDQCDFLLVHAGQHSLTCCIKRCSPGFKAIALEFKRQRIAQRTGGRRDDLSGVCPVCGGKRVGKKEHIAALVFVYLDGTLLKTGRCDRDLRDEYREVTSLAVGNMSGARGPHRTVDEEAKKLPLVRTALLDRKLLCRRRWILEWRIGRPSIFLLRAIQHDRVCVLRGVATNPSTPKRLKNACHL